MIKIDLITGFLGAGKTTFIKKYASYLMEKGMNIGILENDFGAVNVDRLLLDDITGEQCTLEMVAGGCDRDCHRRRFTTKLIAMGMCGYDRVIIEPSGIFDMDEFFDVLHESPLNRWYEIGSVLSVVDAKLEETLSETSEFILASEVACAGCLLLSKVADASREDISRTLAHLNRALEAVHCERCFAPGEEILAKDWESLTEKDFEQLLAAGYRNETYEKRDLEEDEGFQSLYFMNRPIAKEDISQAIEQVFRDSACGQVFRIKGFTKDAEGWLSINATREETRIQPIACGQEVFIVIGEALDERAIADCLYNSNFN